MFFKSINTLTKKIFLKNCLKIFENVTKQLLLLQHISSDFIFIIIDTIAHYTLRDGHSVITFS